MIRERYDVVILGAGLAGLTLARHLLLETERSVLVLERRDELPPARQKVGESTVQLAGYYFAKVLDLEEHLFTRQFMKNNLRFHWKTPGRRNDAIEDYSQSLIRTLSNIPSFQLDRNVLEAELLRLVQADERATVETGVGGLEVALDADGDHRVTFAAGDGERAVAARWVVDATGRRRFLGKKLALDRPNPIRHGSFFWWVEGLVDVEKLTDRTARERRRDPARRITGHVPTWLATNHFMGEGFWFWVIPLHGKTSLGLVYDRASVEQSQVFSVAKATEWICREFPIFARDLPARKVLDFGGFRDFSYDCAQTLSAERWAMVGESGRFSDPLYSPGSDLIAIHNTLIVDAIETEDPGELDAVCARHEQLLRAAYAAYIPSYAESYDVLGDQEAFGLKYVWELTIYFAFYVFPFINDLLTDRRGALAFQRVFSTLGPWNRAIQKLLSEYYAWRKDVSRTIPAEPIRFDFTRVTSLGRAAETFYEVGGTVGDAKRVLAGQLDNVEELARFIAAHVAATVFDEPELVHDRRFIEGLALDDLSLETLGALRARRANGSGEPGEPYRWTIDPDVLAPFRPEPAAAPALRLAPPLADAEPVPVPAAETETSTPAATPDPGQGESSMPSLADAEPATAAEARP